MVKTYDIESEPVGYSGHTLSIEETTWEDGEKYNCHGDWVKFEDYSESRAMCDEYKAAIVRTIELYEDEAPIMAHDLRGVLAKFQTDEDNSE